VNTEAHLERFDRELAWLEAFVARYGINPDRSIEMYLEISRHFETKREQAKTAREARKWEAEARKWAELESFVDDQAAQMTPIVVTVTKRRNADRPSPPE
jgi:hypothetical protein